MSSIADFSRNVSFQKECQLALDLLMRSRMLVLTGPSGSGKSTLVRALHQELHGKDAPLVCQHCASLDSSRFESDLFGHAEGAFTGAIKAFAGLVAMAEGGTLCLEGIASLPQEQQARLLRFLAERRYRRVGGTREREFRGYAIFTSQTPLSHLQEDGLLRADFYFRLAGFEVVLPPLAERPEDLPDLIDAILQELLQEIPSLRQPSAEERDWLAHHLPPGEGHGLRKWLLRAGLQGIPLNALPVAAPLRPFEMPDLGSLKADLQVCERHLLMRALNRSNASRTLLASELGISRRALLYKLKEHGLSSNLR
jgi:DNA-binding NtrC family response regulator